MNTPVAGPAMKPEDKSKPYIGCKVIRAEPMDHKTFLNQQGKHKEADETTFGQGYKVYYPDNYQSWSPKDVFDSAYRLVTDEERRLVHL